MERRPVAVSEGAIGVSRMVENVLLLLERRLTKSVFLARSIEQSLHAPCILRRRITHTDPSDVEEEDLGSAGARHGGSRGEQSTGAPVSHCSFGNT